MFLVCHEHDFNNWIYKCLGMLNKKLFTMIKLADMDSRIMRNNIALTLLRAINFQCDVTYDDGFIINLFFPLFCLLLNIDIFEVFIVLR